MVETDCWNRLLCQGVDKEALWKSALGFNLTRSVVANEVS